MIYNEIAIVKSNKKIAENTFQTVLYSPKISKEIKPGQFINILPSKEWNKVMRRPMSVSSSDGELLNIIYKVVGEGTLEMSNWTNSNEVDIIGPLGNHWNNFKKEPIIIGGGVGIAPILFLHKFLLQEEIKHTLIMGARDVEEHFLHHSTKNNIILTTDNGSTGIKGNALDGLKYKIGKDIDMYKIFVCGPPLMMESILIFCKGHKILCDVALETIMACGFGICQGCTIEFNQSQLKNHSYREKYGLVCCDGPIFNSSEIKTCLV